MVLAVNIDNLVQRLAYDKESDSVARENSGVQGNVREISKNRELIQKKEARNLELDGVRVCRSA